MRFASSSPRASGKSFILCEMRPDGLARNAEQGSECF
jgi:hypothetical protein